MSKKVWIHVAGLRAVPHPLSGRRQNAANAFTILLMGVSLGSSRLTVTPLSQGTRPDLLPTSTLSSQRSQREHFVRLIGKTIAVVLPFMIPSMRAERTPDFVSL